MGVFRLARLLHHAPPAVAQLTRYHGIKPQVPGSLQLLQPGFQPPPHPLCG